MRETSASWTESFLFLLGRGHTVFKASEQVGICWSTAYRHRKADEDFAKAWGAAITTAAEMRELTRSPQHITAKEIEQRYNIPNGTLEHWRSYGCPVLHGKKPRVAKARGPRNESLFLEADIKAIASTPAAQGHLKIKDDDWIIAAVAEIDHGVSRSVIRSARVRPCRYLEGAKIRARKLPHVMNGKGEACRRGRVWFYLETDVEKIAGAMNAEDVPINAKKWPLASQALERFGFSRSTLEQWRKKGCVHTGRKLAAKRAKVQIRNRPGERAAWVYSAKDLKEIAKSSPIQKSYPRAVTVEDSEGKWLSASAAKIRPNRLGYWRQIKRVRAKQIPTPGKASGRAYPRLWVYHAEDIKSAVAFDGRSREARDFKASQRQDASANHQANGHGDPDAEKPSGQAPVSFAPQRRGPLPSERTQTVYQACYEGMEAGKSLKTLVREVSSRFPEPAFSPPKTKQDVSTYAKRYAKAKHKPWPIPRMTE